MEDLSLHILDIAENSFTGGATRLEIVIEEDTRKDMLEIEIIDNGKGMTPEALASALDPFYTTRTTRRIGLGLALFDQAVRMADGKLVLRSAPGRGTHVSAHLRRSHIDRQPLGNMARTISALVATKPEAEIIYRHGKDGRQVTFSTSEFRKLLPDVPLNAAPVLAFITQSLEEEERTLDT
jgi:sensor histidine kinase regulating citrate/malate metabolism